jgi:hypothetical protein
VRILAVFPKLDVAAARGHLISQHQDLVVRWILAAGNKVRWRQMGEVGVQQHGEERISRWRAVGSFKTEAKASAVLACWVQNGAGWGGGVGQYLYTSPYISYLGTLRRGILQGASPFDTFPG